MLLLLCVALWLILIIGGDLSLTLRFVLVFYSPFCIAITSLGDKKVGLCAFRVFVCFEHVALCRFPLFSWFQGLVAICDCGIPWTFSFYLLG